MFLKTICRLVVLRLIMKWGHARGFNPSKKEENLDFEKEKTLIYLWD
jgi:hypothetical protein